MKSFNLILLMGLLSFENLLAWEYDGRHGWPVQKAPEHVIECTPPELMAERMLLESLSGLAAQAVNEGTFKKMVWIKTDNHSYNQIYAQTCKALNVGQPTEMKLWELADYLKKEKVLKGYVLYKLDQIRPDAYASYLDMDYSVNVATVYAGLLKGVLIDESMETEAKRHGLKLLRDVRKESERECFDRNKDRLKNVSALSIPPTVSHLRDYAIAQKIMLYADKKELINEVLEWVRPLSPILGWGCGDEYDFTSLISKWGHYNTASNWCLNLPLISSVGKKASLKKVHDASPQTINYADTASFHAYVMSDGDNMQWTMGAFVDSDIFMGHPDVAN